MSESIVVIAPKFVLKSPKNTFVAGDRGPGLQACGILRPECAASPLPNSGLIFFRVVQDDYILLMINRVISTVSMTVCFIFK